MPFSQTEIALKSVNLGSIQQIPPGEGREFTVDGELIAIFHSRNGKTYATQALCPHRQAPLADGLLGGATLQCPYHAWKFDLETGRKLGDETCELTTYAVNLTAEGEIILTV